MILDHNFDERMKSGDLPSVHGPSAAEVCGWLRLSPSTRRNWVDRGLVQDADPLDRNDVVELFVVNALKEPLQPREQVHAWIRVSEAVLRLKKAPRRLDLVWIEAPPAAELVKTNEELCRLALKKPHRLVVVPLADPISEALKGYHDYMAVAWKTRNRAEAARKRKKTTPRPRGRRPGTPVLRTVGRPQA